MGDVTIGLYGQDFGNEKSQLSSELDDLMHDPGMIARRKEQEFQKSNFDYEHKLKEHLYQFENRQHDSALDGDNHGDAGTMM